MREIRKHSKIGIVQCLLIKFVDRICLILRFVERLDLIGYLLLTKMRGLLLLVVSHPQLVLDLVHHALLVRTPVLDGAHVLGGVTSGRVYAALISICIISRKDEAYHLSQMTLFLPPPCVQGDRE